jgi:hypothetical protein
MKNFILICLLIIGCISIDFCCYSIGYQICNNHWNDAINKTSVNEYGKQMYLKGWREGYK